MLPSEVKILGVPYIVSDGDESLDLGSAGTIDVAGAEIKISNELSAPLAKLALVHEWLHGLLILSGFDALSDNETFVRVIASAISDSFDFKHEG